jgi:predicted nucleic-acid-binding protein
MSNLIDTNVILRFLVKDDEKQYLQAQVWFKEAEGGKRKIVVVPIVVAEACFVLESFYKKTRDEISKSFEVFLAQKWLSVDNREILLSLWPFYRKNLHFVDCFLLATASVSGQKILSFDRKLLKNFS